MKAGNKQNKKTADQQYKNWKKAMKNQRKLNNKQKNEIIEDAIRTIVVNKPTFVFMCMLLSETIRKKLNIKYCSTHVKDYIPNFNRENFIKFLKNSYPEYLDDALFKKVHKSPVWLKNSAVEPRIEFLKYLKTNRLPKKHEKKFFDKKAEAYLNYNYENLIVFKRELLIKCNWCNVFTRTKLEDGLYENHLEFNNYLEEIPKIYFHNLNIVSEIPNFNLENYKKLLAILDKNYDNELNGVYYDAPEKKLIAVNKHGLKYIHVNMGKISFNLHKKSINILTKISKIESIKKVNLLKNNEIAFYCGNITCVCNLLSNDYINWKSQIPTYKSGYLIEVPKTLLKEVNEFGDAIKNKLLELRLSKNPYTLLEFNLKERKIIMKDVILSMRKEWNLKFKKVRRPANVSGIIHPISNSNDKIIIDLPVLNCYNTSQIYYSKLGEEILLINKKTADNQSAKQRIVNKPNK